MASAASAASALPRSKTYASTSPDAATHNQATATGTVRSNEAAARRHGKEEIRAAENADFIHPDHVIPPRQYNGFEDLIIVCCHAVYLPDAESDDFPLHSPHDERNWLLAPFQKSDTATGKPGEHSTFVAHAQAGVNALTTNTENSDLEKNLLVFSGGVTQRSAATVSEARSYYHAALAEELAQGHRGGGRTHQLFSRGRILLEEYATDSFQNLLFSILLFRRTTGLYPKQIRIVTHAFKSTRFLELHAPALRWPSNRIQIQGINPIMSGAELELTLAGEQKTGYSPWREDPLGTGELLSTKRKKRGWDESKVYDLAEDLEDSVKYLLLGTMPDRLPWEADTGSEPTVV